MWAGPSLSTNRIIVILKNVSVMTKCPEEMIPMCRMNSQILCIFKDSFSLDESHNIEVFVYFSITESS